MSKKYALVAVGCIIMGIGYSGLAVAIEDLANGNLELKDTEEGQVAIVQPVYEAYVVHADVNTSAIADREESDEVPEGYKLIEPLKVIWPVEDETGN